MSNGETKQEVSLPPNEIQPPRDDVISKDSEGEREKPLEVSKEVKAEFESKKSDFEKFYKLMKKYRGEGWTLAKIEAQSPRLGPIIQEFREILKRGGAADSNHLLAKVIRIAQEEKYAHDFWQKVSEHKKMSYGSDLEKFYRFFVVGLKNELEAKQQAKAV